MRGYIIKSLMGFNGVIEIDNWRDRSR